MAAIQVIKEADTQSKKTPAVRYQSQNLHVKARTIGTKLDFEMPVSNVSTSGLLLGWKDSRKSPFAVNTILEMEIQHMSTQNARSVGFLGKVVRRFSTEAGLPSFGVKIIQSDVDDQVVWEGIISALNAEIAP